VVRGLAILTLSLSDVDRDFNFSLTCRTLPGKFYDPISPHLRVELRSINARHTRFGHVASGMHDHAWHIHGEISLHRTDIRRLTARIREPDYHLALSVVQVAVQIDR
jgi:hypothetical protein